ncbi:MAG TPA: methionyl-tRNA formyltransferase [Polyangiaceae bacterium]|nr:methionyl-tRNA formyltransferase [Polyangiaceae bacterium]
MEEGRFRALFFGSPSFAVPSLDALVAIASVVAVVCQPDRPAGRGLEVAAPATKLRSRELGLPVVQPTKLRTGEFAEWARAQKVDVALVVAYGRILPKDVLEAPRVGCVNVHASLLPKYRGAAPIAWAIVRGETETGVTLMKLDEGMDTGPTFARLSTPVGPDETAGELSERLARLGAQAVTQWLPKYIRGPCSLVPQDATSATLAPLLKKEHGRIDWTASAKQVHDHVRGMNPWPGAFTSARGRTVKVHATRVVELEQPRVPAGRVLVADKSRVLVATGAGAVELVTVQPEGRRAMSATDWAIGRGVAEGDILGASP